MRPKIIPILGAALLFGLLTVGPASAQDKPKLPEWAPKWKVGDWWVVQTYERDLKPEITGQPAPTSPELPGYPPLRGGIPKGFKMGSKVRFEVKKADATLTDSDDEPDAKPEEKEPGEKPKDLKEDKAEPYFLVAAKAQNGATTRTAQLLYAAADLALGEIEYSLGGARKTRLKVFGTCCHESPASTPFAFPFDWPDFFAAEKAEASLKIQLKKVIQRHTAKSDEKTHVVTLQEDSKTPNACTLTFTKGEPWWTSYESASLQARLIEKGHETPKEK